MEPIVLYNSKDVAKILGVGASAVAQWRKRGTGPLPEPAFQTINGIPLWTFAQLEEMLANQIAQLESGQVRR